MRLLFFTGKGGVGKSTISAAAAWQLSQHARVLIVSLDPAHNLGDVFGVTLNHRKHRQAERLYLMEVDVARHSRSYLEREIGMLSDTYGYNRAINLDSYFSVLKYSPGLEEYTLITSVEETLENEGGFDYIIFDTPPTGLTLRLLALPRITLTWLERLIGLRRLILEKRHTIHNIQGPAADNGGLRLVYDEHEDRVLTRLLGLKERYQKLSARLEGPDSGVVLVFNPDPLSFRETERLIAGLNELHIPMRLLVDNKVEARNEAQAERIEADLLALTGRLPVQRVRHSADLASGGDVPLYQIPEDVVSQLWT